MSISTTKTKKINDTLEKTTVLVGDAILARSEGETAVFTGTLVGEMLLGAIDFFEKNGLLNAYSVSTGNKIVSLKIASAGNRAPDKYHIKAAVPYEYPLTKEPHDRNPKPTNNVGAGWYRYGISDKGYQWEAYFVSVDIGLLELSLKRALQRMKGEGYKVKKTNEFEIILKPNKWYAEGTKRPTHNLYIAGDKVWEGEGAEIDIPARTITTEPVASQPIQSTATPTQQDIEDSKARIHEEAEDVDIENIPF